MYVLLTQWHVSIKTLDPNNFKKDQKSYKNILFYHIIYVIPNCKKPLYLIINTIRYIEESYRNKYLKLVSTDKNKDTLKIFRTMDEY